MDAINIVAIALEKDIGEFGVEALLEDFFQTMLMLAGGVDIELAPGMIHLFHGILVGILGDIPAVHWMLGLKESVGPAIRFCRHCFGNGIQIQQWFREEQFPLRDIDVHREIVEALEGLPNGPIREAFSTFVGVNGPSILEQAPYFDVINMAPQDLMHLLFEGGLSHELRLYLLHCVQVHNLDLEVLNGRIRSFPYSQQDRSNMPLPISIAHLQADGTKLPHQKAAQIWMLARMLPFLLHDLVPQHGAHFDCWRLHLRILFAAAAPEAHPATLPHLRNAIDEHHAQFRLCSPNVDITPKLHFYVHLPGVIRRFAFF